ncbi:MAG: hypothetical protein EA383_17160 [Spirochaetaceae bacterium]|nr:MAG: hypothetical protein EA383_17160 [Spirochaetaceae bacterium]
MRRLSYVMPILFAGLIALLFYQEFRGSERVYLEQSGITLSAYTLAPNLHRDGQVRSLSVSTDGFVVDFSRGRGILRRTESGRAEILNPVDFRERDGGFIIELENGYAVEVLREPGDQPAIQLAIAKPADRSSYRSYEFSLRATEGAVFRRTENSPVLEVQVGDRIYNFILPESALFDAVNRRVILASEPDTQTIRYVFEPTPDPGTVATWARTGELTLSADEHTRLLDAYTEMVHESWTGSRFSAAEGTWQRPEGSPRFDERIVAALMSRAWESTAYDLRASELRNAAATHASARSFRTAPYFGDLSRLAPEMRAELAAQEAELRGLLEQDPVAILHLEDAILRMTVSDILNRIADADLTDAVHAAIADASSDLQPRDAIRVLELLHRSFPISDDLREVLTALEGEALDLLTGLVRRTPDGFFLESTPGRVGIEYSLRAGLALASYSADQRIQQLGRHMVRDVLALADGQQALPETGSLTNGAVDVLSGHLLPEDWYHVLRPAPQAVRMTPLPEPFGDGAFLLSAVRMNSVQSEPGRVIVELNNVPNRTHYVIMQEVPPFSNMELFRLDWRNDPNFENFSRGRAYNASAGTLKIKYTDTQQTGRIVLSF